ncbi:MAG TPA: DNA replication/repair protein RecF [Clostridiales bacterium]|jgi:DNA replication and repair protein RecF|nr:DNA replication/repair protein RecF [Clostridiales bacterium]
MKLQYIDVHAFRNIHNQVVSFSPGCNVFYGDNAQGKTNLLEAVFIFATGKSFRTQKWKELIPENELSFWMDCAVTSDKRNQQLKIFYTEKEGKKLHINGVEAENEKEFTTHLKVVIFTPDSLSLVKGTPAQRRNFLDFAISQLRPRYAAYQKEYARLLLQRNAQLKYITRTGFGREMMPVWDEYIAKLFAKMTLYRRSYVDRIKPVAIEKYSLVSENKEHLRLKYLSNVPEDVTEEGELSRYFLQVLKKNLEDDIKNQFTGVGPHRDDLLLFVGGHPAKSFASQGQQRATVLALKLAEGEIFHQDAGYAPLYLFDDIFSELDEKRQKHLMNTMEDKQALLTTCSRHVNPFSEQGKKFFVENGVYTEE